MKNFLKISLIMLLVQSTLIGQTSASSRVDEVIEMDRINEVISLTEKLEELHSQKQTIQNIDTSLRRTKKGQSIYLKLETFVGGVVVVGIVIGSYKAYFPPGFRAMLSGYVTATMISRGLIKLNDKEMIQLLKQITLINNQIMILEVSLIKQKTAACDGLYQYPLCDY